MVTENESKLIECFVLSEMKCDILLGQAEKLKARIKQLEDFVAENDKIHNKFFKVFDETVANNPEWVELRKNSKISLDEQKSAVTV